MEKDLLLIETMRWQYPQEPATGFYLLDLHMERLRDSAQRLGFSFKEEEIVQELARVEKELAKSKEKIMRVRCTLDRSGTFKTKYAPLDLAIKSPVKIDISAKRVKRSDPYLYHKTTNRRLFDLERQRLGKLGLFETIFLNERGELTQGTITNLFLDMGNGPLLTPALPCGLLPGTFRRHLLEQGKAQEAVLSSDQMLCAKKVYVGNSVRGLLEAVIV